MQILLRTFKAIFQKQFSIIILRSQYVNCPLTFVHSAIKQTSGYEHVSTLGVTLILTFSNEGTVMEHYFI